MENIYLLADEEIVRQMGQRLRRIRLRHRLAQIDLAQAAQLSLSTVKKIERGEIGSFDALLRVMRVLGQLDALAPLIAEDEMSPNEYYDFVTTLRRKQRQRVSRRGVKLQPVSDGEDVEW